MKGLLHSVGGAMAFLLVMHSVTFGQEVKNRGQVLRGTVVDKYSNVPIKGALIELLNHSPRKTTLSVENGLFQLDDIPVGRQRIRVVSKDYYESVVAVLVDAGKELMIEVSLEEEYKALVTVEADRKNRPKDKRRFRNIKMEPINEMTSVSYRSFTIEEAMRYPGSLEDPARLITNFPGMYNIDDTQNYIVSRGNSPFGIRWQVEGIPIDNPHHFAVMSNSGGIFPVLNANLLSNSDFLSGAFAAEYGNSFSGIFDINMRKGNNQRFEFTGELSLFGLEAVAEGPFKKGGASFMISYRYSLLSLIKLLGINIGSAAAPTYQDLNFKIDIPTKKAGHFSLFGIGGLSDAAFPANEVNPDDIFASQGQNFTIHTQLGMLGFTHKKFIGKRAYIKTTASYLYENYQSYRDTVNVAQNTTFPYYRSDEIRHRGGLSITFNSKINTKLTLRSGLFGYLYFFDVQDDDYIRNILVYKSDDILFQVGGYTQLQYKITPRLSLNFGVHGQYFSLNNRSWAVEPRVAINWYIGRRHQLSFGYGWHSRIQPLTISFHVQPTPDSLSYNTGNRDLGFIRSHHAVLSYNLYLAQNWALKSNAYMQFHTNIPVSQVPSNFSLINYGAFGEIPYAVNLKDEGLAYNAGIELSVEKFFSKGYHGVFAASYFRSRYQGSDGVWRNTAFDVQYVLQLLVGKEFKIGKQRRNAITLDLRVNHRGGNPYIPILLEESIAQGQEVRDYSKPYTVRYNPYTRIDFKIGARFNPRRKKISHYIFIDLVNVALLQNDLQARYNPTLQKIEKSRQFGLIPNIFYRIQF